MSAAQLFAIRPEFHGELPDRALDPRVLIVLDLEEGEADLCGTCRETERGPYGPEPVAAGLMRIAWQLTTGGRWYFVNVCSAAHAEDELNWLIGLRYSRYPQLSIVLRLPAWWALAERKTA